MCRHLLLLPVLAILVSSAACGNRNAGFFEDTPNSARQADYVLTRYELGDQGSGDLREGNHLIRRTTIGGYYFRGPMSGGTHQLKPGLYGNPHATQ